MLFVASLSPLSHCSSTQTVLEITSVALPLKFRLKVVPTRVGIIVRFLTISTSSKLILCSLSEEYYTDRGVGVNSGLKW